MAGAALLLVPVLLVAPGRGHAQGLAIEPRVGVVASSALYEDAGVEGLEPVEVGPDVAPELGVLARTQLAAPWWLEAELSYAIGSLVASGGGDDRRTSDLRVVSGSVRVRRAWHRLEGVIGIGGLSYDAPDAQAYTEGASVFPAALLALAVPFQAAGQRMRVEAGVRVHRHQTPVLERAGADAAVVVRGGIHLGVAFGGGR